MLTAEEMEPAGHVHVNAGRLWGGGVGRVAIRPAVLPTVTATGVGRGERPASR